MFQSNSSSNQKHHEDSNSISQNAILIHPYSSIIYEDQEANDTAAHGNVIGVMNIASPQQQSNMYNTNIGSVEEVQSPLQQHINLSQHISQQQAHQHHSQQHHASLQATNHQQLLINTFNLNKFNNLQQQIQQNTISAAEQQQQNYNNLTMNIEQYSKINENLSFNKQTKEKSRKQFDDKFFECEYCFQKFSQKQTLNQHILRHTGQRPFECKVCFKAFTQQGALQRHMAIHTGEKPFQCSFCSLKFRQKINLNRHIKLHIGAPKDFKCDICQREFSRKGAMLRHIDTHNQQRPILKCTCCNKDFLNKDSLLRHEKNQELREKGLEVPKRKKKKMGENGEKEPRRGPYGGGGAKVEKITVDCRKCGKLYRRLQNKLCVFQTFVDNICLKCYESDTPSQVTAENINKTIQTTIQTSEMNCKQQQLQEVNNADKNGFNKIKHENVVRSSVDESNHVLNTYMNSNNYYHRLNASNFGIMREYEIFECPICKSKFEKLSAYKRHKLLHNANRKYECDICHLRFKEKRFIYRHILTHSDVNNYICDICGTQYKYYNKLKGHYINHHYQFETDIENKINFKIYSCHYCNKHFYQRNLIIQHVKVHERNKNKPNVSSRQHVANPAVLAANAIAANHQNKQQQQQQQQQQAVVENKNKTINSVVGKLYNKNSNNTTGMKDGITAEEVWEKINNIHLKQPDNSDGNTSSNYNRYKINQVNLNKNILGVNANKIRKINSMSGEQQFNHTNDDDDDDDPMYESFIEVSYGGENDAANKNDAYENNVNRVGRIEIKTEMNAAGGSVTEYRYNYDNRTNEVMTVPIHRTGSGIINSYGDGDDASKLGPFFCYICKKTYTKKRSLYRHFQMTHTNYERFSCEICGKKFQTRTSLKNHYPLHLPHAYKCNYCEKTFNRRDALASHELVHTGKKQFQCTYCPKSFYQKQSLHTHILQHKVGKQFECGVCGKSFYEKSTLNRHYLSHSGVRNFTCEICNMSFIQKNHLDKHNIRHSEIKKKVIYNCQICEREFYRKDHYIRHSNTHLDMKERKLFNCKLCERDFTDKYSLQRHVKFNKCKFNEDGNEKSEKSTKGTSKKTKTKIKKEYIEEETDDTNSESEDERIEKRMKKNKQKKKLQEKKNKAKKEKQKSKKANSGKGKKKVVSKKKKVVSKKKKEKIISEDEDDYYGDNNDHDEGMRDMEDDEINMKEKIVDEYMMLNDNDKLVNDIIDNEGKIVEDICQVQIEIKKEKE